MGCVSSNAGGPRVSFLDVGPACHTSGSCWLLDSKRQSCGRGNAYLGCAAAYSYWRCVWISPSLSDRGIEHTRAPRWFLLLNVCVSRRLSPY